MTATYLANGTNITKIKELARLAPLRRVGRDSAL